MKIQEIPLTPDNQQFSIALGSQNLGIRVIWRDAAGWVLDLLDDSDSELVSGIPMVCGVDLLAQYPFFGIEGQLIVKSDDEDNEYPTKENLGIRSHLYFVQS